MIMRLKIKFEPRIKTNHIEPKHTHQNERIHAILKKFILTVLLNRRANLKAREKKMKKKKMS